MDPVTSVSLLILVLVLTLAAGGWFDVRQRRRVARSERTRWMAYFDRMTRAATSPLPDAAQPLCRPDLAGGTRREMPSTPLPIVYGEVPAAMAAGDTGTVPLQYVGELVINGQAYDLHRPVPVPYAPTPFEQQCANVAAHYGCGIVLASAQVAFYQPGARGRC